MNILKAAGPASRLTFLACLFLPVVVFAQKAPLPTNYIRVSAPYAQRIVVAEMKQHHELQKIGLHAVPPAAGVNVIIASNIPAKIGKESSFSDMKVVHDGQPTAVRREKGSFYDLAFPIHDAEGRDIGGGLLIMEVPFKYERNRAAALRIGRRIRNELQEQISSKNALYRR